MSEGSTGETFFKDTWVTGRDKLCEGKCLLQSAILITNWKGNASSSFSFNFIMGIYSVYVYIIHILIFFQRQVSLLSKFLLIAKCCYEQRNFATAMQILAGLENLIVRQLPVSLGLCSLAILLNIIWFQYRN